VTSFVGTARLVRLGLRRDRVNLAVWIAGLGLVTAGSVTAVAGIYPTESDRVTGAVFTAGNRLSRAFDGPASGTDLGAMTMVETYGVLAVLAGLMSILIVTRLTRQDEETGRAELLGSAVVGRRARLTAALAVAAGANLALATVTAVALVSQGLAAEGSVAAGAAVGAAGMAFAAVAALTAQLSESQRGATGLAGTALGGAFLLRAVGDAAGTTAGDTKVVSAWPSWLSPIGWGQQVRPFAEDNWDVFGLFGALVVLLVGAAFVVGDRRDLGAGVLRVSRGPATADGRLSSPSRLAWRLQRGTVLAWTLALVVLAAAFASLGDGADEIVGLSEELEAMFTAMVGEGVLLDAYVAFMMSFLGIIAASFTVQALLRTRTEESTGRLEQIMAGGVGRRQWVLATAAVAVGATLGILLLVGVTAGMVFGAVTGDFVTGLRSFGGAIAVQVPAVLALGGLVIALVGLSPRWAAGLAWGALVASLVVGQLGPILDLPQAVMNLSPFSHVPPVPASGFAATPLLALTGIAVILFAVGVEAFRRRDLSL
jgi:ABC-2 type transport system permease protein